MLFVLDPNSPKFMVFEKLNAELLHFLEHAIAGGNFKRSLLTSGDVGQACWDNAKENVANVKSDLTRDKFKKLFTELKKETEGNRQRLYYAANGHQDLTAFFAAPNRGLLSFLSANTFNALKTLMTHLYCSTKDLANVIAGSNGKCINTHFSDFRVINGQVCRACGMEQLAPFRANIEDENQWRADYDHQLCKSKYPIYAVHPDNLIPLCRVCNQDAKKAKDLFKSTLGANRYALNPYTEQASTSIEFEIVNLNDPEPQLKLKWNTQDVTLIDKLKTWDDVYEIRNRVEGRYLSITDRLEDAINPSDYAELIAGVSQKARPVPQATIRRSSWAFWDQKLFLALNGMDKQAFWAEIEFRREQGEEGGEYIIQGG
ncbi:hypothetical protein LHL20_12200 [Alteromonas sp. McT4-15]|uniref:hypothetical protein n=1 Tax=Alteromonas sp. McT4-15 TaxID=2881256 RepID=UPI001CF92547|nr:hypothetical protein [Alteromonas sp. McT4-15]MCB4436987.1 hypothetical protein [Alteromonas sp. McT4-15]